MPMSARTVGESMRARISLRSKVNGPETAAAGAAAAAAAAIGCHKTFNIQIKTV